MKIINDRRFIIVLVLVSIAIYITSCTLSAYTEISAPYGNEYYPTFYCDMSGYRCLLWGGLFMPLSVFGFYDPHFNWALIWFANVFYMIVIYRLLFHKKILFTIIYSFLAVGLSTLFSYIDPYYPYKDVSAQIAYLGPGYFLWVLSIVSILVVAIWNGLRELYNKQERLRFYLLSILSISVVISALAISYTHVFQTRTNNIALDEEKQCFITDNYFNRIVIYDVLSEKKDTLYREYGVNKQRAFRVTGINTYFHDLYCWASPLKQDNNYIITNITFPDKQFMSIHLYVNKNGHATIASTESSD